MFKKVLLRWGREGSYYAGRDHWVGEREQALDLQTIEHATEVGQDLDLESMQVVVSFGDGSYDWFLPLRRRQAAGVQPAAANVQALFRKAA